MAQMNAPESPVIDLTPIDLDEHIRGLLEKKDHERLRRLLADQYPQDIADVLKRFTDPDERSAVFAQLQPYIAAEVIEEVSHYTARQLVMTMSADSAGVLLRNMEIDDIVEILGRVVREADEQQAFQRAQVHRDVGRRHLPTGRDGERLLSATHDVDLLGDRAGGTHLGRDELLVGEHRRDAGDVRVVVGRDGQMHRSLRGWTCSKANAPAATCT